MTSFFAHERFPDNWYRHNGTVSINDVGNSIGDLVTDSNTSVPNPGAKNAQGVWVEDVITFTVSPPST